MGRSEDPSGANDGASAHIHVVNNNVDLVGELS
jgi:hypothetical protein